MQTEYPIVEEFYTLQGEGYWTGTASYFLRLAGCDVGCHWCDTKESWEMEAHTVWKANEILDRIFASSAKRVVITGGEPFMHDLNELTSGLRNAGLYVTVETSGAHPFSGTWDWISLSPKKFKPTLDVFFEKCDELKVVVLNKHDLIWAQELAARCTKSPHLFLQAEWNSPKSNALIVEFVKAHPEWRLSLQSHKYLEIP